MKVLSFLLSLFILTACASTDTKPKQYLISHIMCATEHEANQARLRVLAGEPFEDVAKTMSTDPGTKNKGGRIAQWSAAGAFSANFANEVKQLNIGQISAKPVKTEFGWHVVRVDAIH